MQIQRMGIPGVQVSPALTQTSAQFVGNKTLQDTQWNREYFLKWMDMIMRRNAQQIETHRINSQREMGYAQMGAQAAATIGSAGLGALAMAPMMAAGVGTAGSMAAKTATTLGENAANMGLQNAGMGSWAQQQGMRLNNLPFNM